MKISIIGLGLIGGSIAMAAKRAGISVNGFDINANTLAYALKQQIIDSQFNTIKQAILTADIIIVAVTPEKLAQVFSELNIHLNDQQIITDATSVNHQPIQLAKQIFLEKSKNFITSHPLYGSEKTGIKAAKIDLLTNRKVVISPTDENSPETINQLKQFWQKIKLIPLELNAEQHDEIIALTSHLPHIIAYAFSNTFLDHAEQDKAAQMTAGSFADLTRIATSSPNLWTDICLLNRNAILTELNKLSVKLNGIKAALENNDSSRLLDLFTIATEIKKWRE